ncbi:MAG: acyl-CoA thioesterase [Candidatus Melainabacteria bacterium HGW-Melainabacteria-1]|nr:MAG: acyl-CoA thioesterase [Candidatus Melainabacteria bacterium HGW-Melainabacteria-1]
MSTPHTTDFTVSETWLDSFGHVNNARYLEIFEQARWNWLVAGGIDSGLIRSTGIGPVILELTLRFRKELLPRQQFRIHSWCESYRKKILIIQQELRLLDAQGASDELAAEIRLTAGLMDLAERKLIDPPPEWQAGMGVEWEA